MRTQTPAHAPRLRVPLLRVNPCCHLFYSFRDSLSKSSIRNIYMCLQVYRGIPTKGCNKYVLFCFWALSERFFLISRYKSTLFLNRIAQHFIWVMHLSMFSQPPIDGHLNHSCTYTSCTCVYIDHTHPYTCMYLYIYVQICTCLICKCECKTYMHMYVLILWL